jgi:serine/threonine protein kinase
METRWGKRFGRYEVVAELGRGAMGIVYKARDPKIDRFVAIKTICLVGHVREEQEVYRERFFQEAQAAGRLIHPNIVTIFDVGEDPETLDPYIVMEYVAGVPLNGMLEEGKPLPLDTAMHLAQQVAEALDCAHAQGIVHRDIKPSNIMVTAEGQAKIMDFGIARLNMTHLTLPGHALGMPAYISPEQLNGDPVDGRADIFSLGVILYNMVTGYRPFQGNSVITVCFKVANREPLAHPTRSKFAWRTRLRDCSCHRQKPRGSLPAWNGVGSGSRRVDGKTRAFRKKQAAGQECQSPDAVGPNTCPVGGGLGVRPVVSFRSLPFQKQSSWSARA